LRLQDYTEGSKFIAVATTAEPFDEVLVLQRGVDQL